MPVLGAHWQGDDPYDAEVFYQNDSFIKLYGDLSGQEIDPVGFAEKKFYLALLIPI